MTVVHRAIAVLVCLLVPLGSLLSGSRRLAWPMFSGSESYRLRVIGRDATSWFFIAPSELARGASRDAAIFFAGAEHFRHGADADVVRDHLDQVAEHACRSAPRALEVVVVLVERSSDDAPATEHRARASCGR